MTSLIRSDEWLAHVYVTALASHLCCTKQPDCCLVSMQLTLFNLNLLEAQALGLWIKVFQRRTLPLLIFLRVLMLQAIDVLCELLEYFFFELALRLTGAKFQWSICILLRLREVNVLGNRRSIMSALLAAWGLHVPPGVCAVGKNMSGRWWLHYYRRHP